MDPDSVLDMLGNSTRRRILQALSQEPMYFNQLAKELGIGQQAVLRHLQALEDTGIIETYGEKSDLGAPDRKYYRLNTSFFLTISISEDSFTISNQQISQLHRNESKKYYSKMDVVPEDTGHALSYLQENLAEIEEEISSSEERLGDLRAVKQLILRRLHEIGKDNFEQAERKVLFKIVEESPKSVMELSNMVDEKESRLRSLITSMAGKMGKDSARELFEDLQ